jgi:uncharacterized protein YdeI (YjbR/CyaY-like superfamily)
VDPRFFPTLADWRAWLEKHHAQEKELLVGFYKRDSGEPSITWPESVDGALCFGWIDGVRRRIDDRRYSIRFTPRRPRSVWSAINIARVAELSAQGAMHPAGAKAFEARQVERSGIYAYERSPKELEGPFARQLKSNSAAWEFFQSQPPSYRKVAAWWVISAKREETKLKRLATLIDDSAQGRRIRQARLASKP